MTLKDSFLRRKFSFLEFQRGEDAVSYLCDVCSGHSVGFGGSVTLRDLGLYERLSEGSDVSWHWKNDPIRSRLPKYT